MNETLQNKKSQADATEKSLWKSMKYVTPNFHSDPKKANKFLDEGSLMADYELFENIGCMVSFVAYTPCEILSIQKEDLVVLPENMSEDF